MADNFPAENFPAVGAKYWHRLGFERELWQQGTLNVAGVDEAGCGPLAGPVVAAAVLFPCSWLETGLHTKLRGLNDSKQLTEEDRERYFSIITTHPEISYGIGVVDVQTIDQINILQAAGLVKTERGPAGGAHLARSPGRIKIGDIYKAVEEPVLFAAHRRKPSKACPVGCRIEPVLAQLFARGSKALEREFESITLDSVVRKIRRG